jgi:phosphopantothenoylcysteine synthetase/decarboxylase
MSIRKILGGIWTYETANDEVEELENSVHLAVITKAPQKYLLIDLENGKMYRGSNSNNKHLPGYKLWNEIDKDK